MAIKNTILGGADWESPSRIKPTDLNDTIDELANRTNVLRQIFSSFEQETLSVTDTSASVSYSAEMSTHLIKNIGNNVCYINFDAAATTDSYKLNPSDVLNIDTLGTAIHAICATGLTTTLRIIGQK